MGTLNTGIVAMDCYFPNLCISQKQFETHLGVSKGKYTIGLGQRKISFTNDREDVCSMALTVLSRLVENYKIPYEKIGRLEVATETIQDHSKSIKTFLMDLFESSGNFNVEGVDSKNACYAATSALFNSVAWAESSESDGKLAVVVAVDIAEYANGPARPTSGCGAVAFAVGRNSPLPLEPRCRFSHMRHVFDFYKPHLNSPHPIVDGHFSNLCYMKALDDCYNGFCERFSKSYGETISVVGGGIDFVLFHSPYNKLVEKSFSRIIFNDFMKSKENEFFKEKKEFLSKFTLQESYTSRELMSELLKISKSLYNEKVLSSTEFCKEIGNSYTASVYFSLISLLANNDIKKLTGKRIAIFSYGSGLTSSMFSIKIPKDLESRNNSNSNKQLEKMIKISSNYKKTLQNRIEKTPNIFETEMDKKEENYTKRDFEAEGEIEHISDGVYYFVKKDKFGRRIYKRK